MNNTEALLGRQAGSIESAGNVTGASSLENSDAMDDERMQFSSQSAATAFFHAEDIISAVCVYFSLPPLVAGVLNGRSNETSSSSLS